jgi:hypothetical protein
LFVEVASVNAGHAFAPAAQFGEARTGKSSTGESASFMPCRRRVVKIAGKGPRPKDPDKLAGGHAKARQAGMRVYTTEPVSQPPLPDDFIWPDATIRWWEKWGEAPMAVDFSETDWDFLIDTALIHAEYWRGDLKLAGELRLRVAKMGATAEDRARLRITYATADVAENRRDRMSPSAPNSIPPQYQGLKAVD